MSAVLALVPEPGDRLPEQRPDPEAVAPLSIPPYVVAAIAQAAVEAYKQAVREEQKLYQRAYYQANRERLLRLQRARRAARRPHVL